MEAPWMKPQAHRVGQDQELALSDIQKIGAIAARSSGWTSDTPHDRNGLTQITSAMESLESQSPNSRQAVLALASNKAAASAGRRRPPPPPPPPKKGTLSAKPQITSRSSPAQKPDCSQLQETSVANLTACRIGADLRSRVAPPPPQRPQLPPTPPATPEPQAPALRAAAPQDAHHSDQRPKTSRPPPRLPPRRPTPGAPPSTATTAERSPSPHSLGLTVSLNQQHLSPHCEPRYASPSPPDNNAPEKKPNSLCAECSKIDFTQFGKTNASVESTPTDPGVCPSAHLINLKHLLSKRHSCSFCSLLVRALCLPLNDPLRDEELQESILKDKKFQDLRSRESPCWVDFETWANNREKFNIKKEAKWPFGHTYDNVNVKEIKADTGREVDFEEGGGSDRRDAAAVNQGARVGLAAGKHFDNNRDRAKVYGFAMDVLPDMDVISSMTKKGVPAVVRVVVYPVSHRKSGVLEVTVFGCAKARGRDIKTLSHFALRVASPVPSALPQHEKHLRYGRLVDRRSIDLSLCRRWLSHCSTTHGASCNAPAWSVTLEKPSGIPFRLVDVLDGSIVEADPRNHEYAALSYVWGDIAHHADILSLSNYNLPTLSSRGGLGGKNLGRAITDAIDIVRTLGMRYLWADRLCIIQDSDIDKAHQVSQMDRIYGGAAVTLVAASGTHLDEPISGVTTARTVSQLAECVTSDPVVNVLLPMQSGGYPDLKPWAGRAWTLQEKLLSRRLLIFHDGMVDFRCPHGTMHEDMSAIDADSRPPPVGWLSLKDTNLFSEVKTSSYGRSGPRLLRSSIFAEYAGLIHEYTPRQMTNPMDAVNAVMGMLKILIVNQQNPQARKRLLHGLPEEFLDQALHWQPAAKEGVSLRLRKDRKFPTWSWAAWEAAEETDPVSRQRVVRPGGVQYEATYRVQTDNRGRLQKVLQLQKSREDSEQVEERMRPLLRWYTVDNSTPPVPPARKLPALSPGGKPPRTPPPLPPRRGNVSPTKQSDSLRPLNQNGLGLALSPDTSLEEWSDSVSSATKNLTLDRPLPSLPAEMKRQLRSEYHLVFRTLIAQFTLGETRTRTETLWRKTGDGSLVAARELHIRETAVLAVNCREVGRVVLPYGIAAGTVGEFVLLSEGQFFGDEESIEVGEYPLFNVMLVRWLF
ncbi:heterokaryon incompatibility protein-domain-containing protein [Cercophora newfieldiana]|uniref:Heterokaryon incompatibility protein-domain-containing protein n=1 Tax=Cercophora newfieldiana TaxID=92897 RepID=A0AA39YBE7_9PEZI|nr:heterokaryon incompatibility protein-domain-containing protein [Cercophora newfieldiana]